MIEDWEEDEEDNEDKVYALIKDYRIIRKGPDAFTRNKKEIREFYLSFPEKEREEIVVCEAEVLDLDDPNLYFTPAKYFHGNPPKSVTVSHNSLDYRRKAKTNEPGKWVKVE